MSTNESIWRRLLRYSITPKPFWRARLTDRLDARAEGGGFDWAAVWNAFSMPILFLVVGAVVVVLLARFLIVPILLSPGLLVDGLADPIGRGLAALCAPGAECNVQSLMASTVVGALVLVVMVMSMFSGVGRMNDSDEVSEQELLEVLGALDERVVHLRADLVLAGVLPLTPEETEDA